MWGVAVAAMSAISGANSYIVMKALSDFLYLTFHGENQFKNEWMYATIVALVAFLGIQMICLNKGLSKCDAAWFLPIYTALLTVAWVALSLFIFEDEFENMSKKQLLCFCGGINVVIWGVTALCHTRPVVMGGQGLLSTDFGAEDREQSASLVEMRGGGSLDREEAKHRLPHLKPDNFL